MKAGDDVRYNGKTWRVTRITPGGGLVMLVDLKDPKRQQKMVPTRNVEVV